MQDTSLSEAASALATTGAVRITGPFRRVEQAWSKAREVVDGATGDEPPLAIIGDFVLPPADRPPNRDFQTLHFDFGLPLIPVMPVDVAGSPPCTLRPESGRAPRRHDLCRFAH